MSRIHNILRGVVLASVLVLVPAVAKAHGGGCGYSFNCYPRCYSSCYSCYSPCYQTYPLYYQTYTPVIQVVQQPLVQQAIVQPAVVPYARTFATPYVANYGGCKVFIHK